jgi:hypothetical protein
MSWDSPGWQKAKADYHATRTSTAKNRSSGFNGSGTDSETVVRLHRAQQQENLASDKILSPEDFYCYMPMPNSFIFTLTREIWPAASVNARIPPIQVGKETMKPSAWLASNRPIEQMTWAPGLPMIVEGKVISGGGWIERPGSDCFNQYRPPTIEHGDPTMAGPWIDHIKKIYPDDVTHIIYWFAYRVQRPEIKINHALVLGGPQGIGKDTLLEPVKHSVGPWNFEEVSPQAMLQRFNGYVKSVILRVSEARDLGETNRYAFYDHMKVYTAAPPDVLRVDEKHLRAHPVLNCTGVIFTTNHKADGIYLLADDRRHYVAWSDLTQEDFTEDYWQRLWGWYESGGYSHVAAYLAGLDLSAFNPKAPPPKTAAFWEIVNANHAPENAELADIIEEMGNPYVLTLKDLQLRASEDFGEWLRNHRNRRVIPHRLESLDYVPVRNPTPKDGLWKIAGKRQAVYGQKSLTVSQRLGAAGRLAGGK